MWAYIYYRMYLLRKDTSELTGMEAYLKAQMDKQNIGYFPNGKALALESVMEEEENEMVDLKGAVDQLNDKVDANMDKLDLLTQQLAQLTEAKAKSAEGQPAASASTGADV
eukprot:CAMPEP_0113941404 /NCGR_PEP_ID=MMETSP1339-20121228/7321_1 /TAXON_ID=94617 /ORGANISM="Fibrocapsa japonica" /LENGTH=110 /DNA_ID=CAMNT_0000945535 /DNA_START=117 /DNA_END=449 /DNA_ORIENTATION=+ /assembly_acc=CAM_ASM_000762